MGAGERCEDHDVEAPCGAHGVVAARDECGDGLTEARPVPLPQAETIAQCFHEEYERLAPHWSYETRKASAVPWAEVPENNKALMIDVVSTLIRRGVIG